MATFPTRLGYHASTITRGGSSKIGMLDASSTAIAVEKTSRSEIYPKIAIFAEDSQVVLDSSSPVICCRSLIEHCHSTSYATF